MPCGRPLAAFSFSEPSLGLKHGSQATQSSGLARVPNAIIGSYTQALLNTNLEFGLTELGLANSISEQGRIAAGTLVLAQHSGEYSTCLLL